MFAGIGAWWALKGGLKGVLGMVPRAVWIALAAAVVIFVAYKVADGHFHRQLQTARAEASAARDVAWQKRLDKAHADAMTWKQKYTDASNQLATARRTAHEKELQSIAFRSNALLVRGPGAAQARCRPGDNSGLSAAPGQRQPTTSVQDATGPGVPTGQWATVPWNWLVTRTAEHDELLSEATQWRAWHPEQAELLRQKKLELQNANGH